MTLPREPLYNLRTSAGLRLGGVLAVERPNVVSYSVANLPEGRKPRLLAGLDTGGGSYMRAL
jgi:hypothetical protein